MSRRDFDKRQLAAGTKHELEHTPGKGATDKRAAELIAAHHLAEDKDYYCKLERLEEFGKQPARSRETVLLFAAQSIRWR